MHGGSSLVLDLGAGGGFDCFLAARAVGTTGQVIGVDMTPELVTLARANSRKANVANVAFRLGDDSGHAPVTHGLRRRHERPLRSLA